MVDKALQVVDQTAQETQAALDSILENRRNGPKALTKPLYVEYQPRDGGPTKMLKVIDIRHDPLEPVRHKIVSTPEVHMELDTPIMREEHQLTEQDKKDWRIPRVNSAWKNPDYQLIDLKDRARTDPKQRRPVPQLSNRMVDLATALAGAEQEQKVAQELDLLQRAQAEAEEQELKDKLLAKVAQKARRNGSHRRHPNKRPRSPEREDTEQFDTRLFAKARPASTSAYDGPLFANQAMHEMFKGQDKVEFEKE